MAETNRTKLRRLRTRCVTDESIGITFATAGQLTEEEVRAELRQHDDDLAEQASTYDVLSGVMLNLQRREWFMEQMQGKLRAEDCPVSGYSTFRNLLADQHKGLMDLHAHRQ